MIPLQLEDENGYRKRNIKLIVDNLLNTYDANIKIIESGSSQKYEPPLDSRIDYKFEQSDSPYLHRTRLINEMLDSVETEFACNYDADILFSPKTFQKAENLLGSGEADVVYPFGKLKMDQFRIWADVNYHKVFDANEFEFELNNEFKSGAFEEVQPWLTHYGHCQIFRTQVYRDGYMENENYLHLCPEDFERGERFQKLGYNVKWMTDNKVLHFEHPCPSRPEHGSRATVGECRNLLNKYNLPYDTDISFDDFVEIQMDEGNPFVVDEKPAFEQAKIYQELVPGVYDVYDLHDRIIAMNKEELIEYYKNEVYLNKYKKECV